MFVRAAYRLRVRVILIKLTVKRTAPAVQFLFVRSLLRGHLLRMANEKAENPCLVGAINAKRVNPAVLSTVPGSRPLCRLIFPSLRFVRCVLPSSSFLLIYYLAGGKGLTELRETCAKGPAGSNEPPSRCSKICLSAATVLLATEL